MGNSIEGVTEADLAFLVSGPQHPKTVREEGDSREEGSPEPRKPGRDPIYPWNEWLDGKYHIVKCNTARIQIPKEALRRRINSRASRTGLWVWTEALENPDELGFQFFKSKADMDLAKTKRREAEWEAQMMAGGPEDEDEVA